MSIPYSAGTAFTTPTCVSAWVEYPFASMGDPATKVYHHIIQVERLSYAPLDYDDVMTLAGDKPARSPFADDAGAYWVEDSTPSDIGGTLVEFERLFANIPDDRVDPNGLYPFQFPGTGATTTVSVGNSTGNYSETVSSAQGEVFTADIVFDMSSTDAAKVEAGDWVRLENNGDTFTFDADDGSGAFSLSFLSNAFTDYECRVKSVISSTITVEFTVLDKITGAAPTASGNPNTTRVDYTLRHESLAARDPLQESSASVIAISYEKISDPLNIADLETIFKVSTTGGATTDTLSSSTNPSSVDYTKKVGRWDYVNAENQSFERWRGNIYERRTIKVVAQ